MSAARHPTENLDRPDARSSFTRILIVARHALVRAGLRTILTENPGLRVVAEAHDGAAAIRSAKRLSPDVVLLSDLDAGAADSIRRALPRVCIVCLEHRGDLLPSGIHCVPCDAGVSEFCSVLGAVLGGRCAGCAFRKTCPAPHIAAALSRRETQVAVCVSRGMSSKQIAGALGIGLRTVNTYRESLARKIGASSGAIVTRYVLEHEITAVVPDVAL